MGILKTFNVKDVRTQHGYDHEDHTKQNAGIINRL